MKNLLPLLLTAVCIFIFSYLNAQDFNFRNLGINDGLPSGRVHSVTQGKNGFMYFGTNDGLVRYDGERMKVYHHINADSTSIPSNKVKALLTDKDGNIWCAHDKFGISIFNPVTENFKTIAFKNLSNNKIFSGFINHLYEDSNGIVYACSFFSLQGILLIDSKSRSIKQLLPTELDPFHLLTKDNDNIIDLNFYSDTLWLLGSTNGLLFYNPIKKQVWKCLKIEDTNNNTWLNIIDGFVIDKNRNLYFGSWAGGLHYYDFTNNSVSTYSKTSTDFKLDANAPKCFINDSTLLLVAWDLFFFNTHSKLISKVNPDILNKYSFVGRSSDAFQATDSSVWLSTLTGVSYFNPNKNDFKTKILFKPDEWLNVNPKVEFHWICFDKLFRTYIVNYRDYKALPNKYHLTIYDEEFNPLYDLQHPLINGTATFLNAGDNKGKVFFNGDISGKQKIMMLDLNSKKITEPFSKYHFLDSMNLTGLFLNHDTLFTIALNQNQFVKFNVNTFEIIKAISINKQTGVYNYTNSSIQFDKMRNVFWISSESGFYELNSINGQMNRIENDSISKLLLQNTRINSMTIDNKKNLWIAFSNGLIQFDPDANRVLKYLDENQLPSLNTYNLFCDSSGFIWSDCSKGIMRIDPATFTVQLFNSNNGLQPLTYPGRADLLSSGNLIIPFAGGFVLYDTRKHDTETQHVIPIITALKNFENEIKTDSGVTQLSRIVFPFHDNNITIEFTALNFSNASFTQYAYKLEGLNDQFSYSTLPSITYNNLQPGIYIFHLKSSWDGKQWSYERTLQITVTPPWHHTWWFRSLIILISISLILFGYRYRIAQISKEEKLKAEFKNQLMEMEMTALRSQMNPHFIFNSLNSINRYVMQNDRLTASEYIAKFGKLMRNVLDNSRSETISLQLELSTLELYIQMEKLRFEDKFEYKIIISDDVDSNGIKIPPLLIQPFVENSIWHGLMHKEEKGLVTINAKMKSENLLEISIEDNGIGRAKATELKSKNTGHNSHGLKVTSERIKIINEVYKQENKLEVIDLYDENKNAIGTRVVLLIPA